MIEVATAAIAGLTAVLVAYIGLKQAQVKRELDRVNGTLRAVLRDELESARVREARRRAG